MELHRLRLRNFRQHAATEVLFGPGLTGIIGPNGVGKTTLLEAIAWALYGTPAARGNRDSIRRRGAPPRSRVEVELEFTLGAHRYRVLRTLADAALHQDGGDSPIATSLGGVTERLTKLLGMTREEFFSTYFTGQKELAIMAAMTPSERGQFLSRVLGYERLRVAQDRLREARSRLRARLGGLEDGLADEAALAADEGAISERLATVTVQATRLRAERERSAVVLAAVRPRWESLQQLQERVRSVASDLRMADKDVVQERQAIEKLDHDLAEAIAAQARLAELQAQVAPLAGLRQERDRLDDAARILARRREAQGQIAELSRELEVIGVRLAVLPELAAATEARIRRDELRIALEQRVRTSRDLRTAWVRDAQDATTRRQQLLDQFGELTRQREQLVSLGPDGACPTCSRVLGEEYANVVGVLERQIAEIETNGRYFRQRLDQLKAEPTDLVAAESERTGLEARLATLTSRVVELVTQVREREGTELRRTELEARLAGLREAAEGEAVTYDEARHAEVRRVILALEPVAAEALRHAAMAERSERLGSQMAEAEQRLSVSEAVATRLREEIEGLGWSEELFAETGEQFASATRSAQETEVQVARVEAEEAAARESQAALARRRAERTRRLAAIDVLRIDLRLNQELDTAFADLRTDLNAQLRPDLSELASGFLRDLTTGRYTDLELDEDYVATIVEDGDPKPVISGGEEDVINLALRLAISQMIAERAGQPLSLLVLDEIFGSLDEERRGAVLDLLRQLADRFPQVILITHIDTVRDGFDRVIRVTFDAVEGVARVVDEPLPEPHDAAA
ncbi:MAG: SMC family ATPase [Gemmatimonadota bacterium]|nr:SMC family ATPase [Gemmatimonadota bacterium]